MVNIIKQEITIEESLKKKLEFICSFCNTTKNGSIHKIDKTNLTYVEPHRIFINNITFLAFNSSFLVEGVEIMNEEKKIENRDLMNMKRSKIKSGDFEKLECKK